MLNYFLHNVARKCYIIWNITNTAANINMSILALVLMEDSLCTATLGPLLWRNWYSAEWTSGRWSKIFNFLMRQLLYITTEAVHRLGFRAWKLIPSPQWKMINENSLYQKSLYFRCYNQLGRYFLGNFIFKCIGHMSFLRKSLQFCLEAFEFFALFFFFKQTMHLSWGHVEGCKWESPLLVKSLTG